MNHTTPDPTLRRGGKGAGARLVDVSCLLSYELGTLLSPEEIVLVIVAGVAAMLMMMMMMMMMVISNGSICVL